MFSTLILSAFLGIPTSAPLPAPASRQAPPIRVWLNDDGRYQPGDPVKVQVSAHHDGYLLVLHVDRDRRLRVLFPLDPGDDNFVRGGKEYEIVDRGGREAFVISARSGHGTVYAAVSHDPFRFDRYVRGARWDLGALDDVRMSARLEDDLNAFVRELARTDFDYDLLGYDIYESVVYGGSPPGYGYGPPGYPYPAWGYRGLGYQGGGFGGTSIFIGLGFGRPFRPFFFSPFFFDPFFFNPFFFNPFFFDPFFFRPFFFDPFFFRPVFPVRPFFPVGSFFLAFGPGFPVFHAGFPIARFPLGQSPFGRGFFTTPWRRRGTQTFFAGGSPWRGRDVTGIVASGTVTGYRGHFGGSRLLSGPAATPVRATPSDAASRRRSLDMTPGRIESARPQRAPLSAAPMAPQARRAVDRPEWSSSRGMPERVGRPGDETRGIRARGPDRPSSWPSRVPEARPGRRDLGDGSARSGYEGARIIQPREPAARRADNGWPASLGDMGGERRAAPFTGRGEALRPGAPMVREWTGGVRGAVLRPWGGWRGTGGRGRGGVWRR